MILANHGVREPVGDGRGPVRQHPTVSVVIVASPERETLDRCLARLLPQCEGRVAEILVVGAREMEPREPIVNSPSIRFVESPTGKSVRQLRTLAMAEATGDIIAFVEDHRIAYGDSLEPLLQVRVASTDKAGVYPPSNQNQFGHSTDPTSFRE